MYCMKCGAQNDDTARFCIRCGTRLVRPEPAPSPSPSPPKTTPDRRSPPSSPVLEDRYLASPEPLEPVQPVRRRGLRRGIITQAVVALVLVLLCGVILVAAYYWLGLSETNRTARIVSADTPVLISVGPDPRQAGHFLDAENLEMLLPVFGLVPELREVAEEVQSSELVELDVDVRKDLLPWIGAELGVVVMDAQGRGPGDVLPVIMTVATRDKNRSDAFLLKMREALEQQGIDFEEETYRDTRVVYQVPDYEGAFAPAFATIEELVVVGTDREALHQAIDTALTPGASTLADQTAYEAVLDALPANRLGYLYLDGRTLADSLSDEVGLSLEQEIVDGIGIAFGLGTDGVRLDYVLRLDPEVLRQGQQGAGKRPLHRPETADRVPNQAAVYWSGQDLSVGWQTVMALLEGMAAFEEVEELLEEVRDETGVDLEEDVVSNTKGEYALAVIPARSDLFGIEDLAIDLQVLVNAADARGLESSLDAFAEFAEEEGGVELDGRSIGGVRFEMLVYPREEWELGYGFADDLLIGGTSETMLRAGAAGPSRPLSEADSFKATMGPLPGSAHHYLYLDLDEIISMTRDAMGSDYEEFFDDEIQPYIDPISAIGLSLTVEEDEAIARGTLFLYSGGE